MTKVNVAGVLIDNLTKDEALASVSSFMRGSEKGYIATPYSEMIVFAIDDPKYRKALNGATLALADGIGVVWAAKLFGSKIKERITGRKFIYDLCQLAQENNFSLALVGGTDNVAVLAAEKLKKLYPGLKINLAVSDEPFDEKIIGRINNSNSDILLIAYSPPKQEQWLHDNIEKLHLKLAMGLGGTFDYLAGKRATAPEFVHRMGLEWLWRLITQPWRVKRIWNAVPVFIWKIYRYKMTYMVS